MPNPVLVGLYKDLAKAEKDEASAKKVGDKEKEVEATARVKVARAEIARILYLSKR